MMHLRNALLLSLALSACGNSKSADPAAVIAKYTAINEKTCACKDVPCVEAATKEHALVMQDVQQVDKNNKDVLSKLADLQIEHNKCVNQAMAAAGHK
jgi:seryl-tRNA(Sec) selenium transferase